MPNCIRKYLTTPVLLLSVAVGTVFLILIITITCIHEDSWGPHANAPKVTVQQGVIRGIYSLSRKKHKVISFLSVPYAAPPIGERRFKMPEPPDEWLGTRDATKDLPMCLQLTSNGVVGQEDCLYLNIHIRELPEESSKLLPVMVWIHGGGFFSGSGNSKFFKPTYILDHDVVLVTLNYRLGPLGFLSTGDDSLPGNYGLKDQVAALLWVRDNIEQFGGNPQSVTIFGGSVGGTSVHYHMLSPMSQGLFHRAISQSGTALGPFALTSLEVAKSRAMKVASILKCPTHSINQMVECLRNSNATTLTSTYSQFVMWGGIPTVAFPPVVEHFGSHKFLPDTPLNILKAKKSAPVPWMTGINAQDGCIVAESILDDPVKVTEFENRFKSLAFETTYFITENNDDKSADEIYKFYFGKGPVSNESVNNIMNMYTDSYFTYPLNQSVTLQAAVSDKVFVYYFTYVGSMSNSVLYGDTNKVYGSCHGDELLYLFPFESILPNFTQTKDDYRMIDVMTTIWTNFAKSGNPTEKLNGLIPVIWDPVTSKSGNYLEIERHLQRRTNLLPLAIKLWDHWFNSISRMQTQ